MKFISLQPFVPSGPDFEKSKQLFIEMGFQVNWEEGDYIGFQKDDCGFILQRFNKREFAENFMLTIRVDHVDAFHESLLQKQLPQKFGVHIGSPSDMPYGREVNVIDIAGVCWHFVQP